MNKLKDLQNREPTWFTSTISGDNNGQTQILGEDLTKLATQKSFSYLLGSMLLGKKLSSKKTEQLIDLILKLLIDHGPYQSGPVNTMIAARAGKDLISSLTAGLLTIGNRFGGAVNAAADIWFKAVNEKTDPNELVSKMAKQKQYIPGIGHRKYRLDMPDPRVKLLKERGQSLSVHPYLDYVFCFCLMI